MTDRPILFSGPMVRALLAGRKTQTRRVVKGLPFEADRASPSRTMPAHWFTRDSDGRSTSLVCPYGVPGDRLWVKETWALHERFTDVARVVYAASQGQSWSEMHRDVPVETAVTRYAPKPFQEGFRPSIHMPHWASRLTLEITDIRVERLQDISEADALAEGIIEYEPTEEDPAEFAHTNGGEIWNNAVSAYAGLWRKINGPDSWAANPWVWAVSFEVEARP